MGFLVRDLLMQIVSLAPQRYRRIQKIGVGDCESVSPRCNLLDERVNGDSGCENEHGE